jgi:hypothetical protein
LSANNIQTRYLHPRLPVPKSGQLHLAWEYALNPAHHNCFIGMMRVSLTTFEVLADLIRDSHVFQNNSNMPQAPVKTQLAVTLYCLGRFGNAASIMDVACMAGILEGSVKDYTDRCIKAILPLHNDLV